MLRLALLAAASLATMAWADPYGFGNGSQGALTVLKDQTWLSPTAALLSDAPAGSTSLEVSSTLGFSAGQLILIIATRDLTGGDSRSADQVGRYQLGRATSVIGQQLALDAPLTQSFYGSGTQVVVVGEYSDLQIAPDAGLSGLPWDGARGGALALVVSGTFSNFGTVSARGAGYLGGAAGESTNCRPAAMGDGWAFGPHDGGLLTSGGGGAYCITTSSALPGGGGGGNWGQGGGSHWTDGGASLQAHGPRLVMGGGGGGATSDAPYAGGRGGPGGGVLFVRARRIEGSGEFTAEGVAGISNGYNGVNGGATGAGGGGAGGTVYLEVGEWLRCGRTTAAGGNGGGFTAVNYTGTGGGGGGGRVILAGPDLAGCPVDVTGGVAGKAPNGLSGGGSPLSGALPPFLGKVLVLVPGAEDGGGDGGSHGGTGLRITSQPPSEALCGSKYDYAPQLEAAGPASWALEPGANVDRAQVSFDGASGALGWQVPADARGSYRFELRATRDGQIFTQQFSVQVACLNELQVRGCSCGSGAGALLLPGLLAGLAWFARRGRRQGTGGGRRRAGRPP